MSEIVVVSEKQPILEDENSDKTSNQREMCIEEEMQIIDQLLERNVHSSVPNNNLLTVDGNNKSTETQKQPQFYFRGSIPLRKLKKPQPQPHICIRDRTVEGQDIYINVLSWGKLNKPKDAMEPIQLYGGMRVEFLNLYYKKLLIYAVAANPEVLEKTKRNTGNLQSQYALMVLMSQYVEAMNPGLKLKNEPSILLDRDLVGELKDIWQTIQSQREKEKFLNDSLFYEAFGPSIKEIDDSVSKNVSKIQSNKQFKSEVLPVNMKNGINLNSQTNLDIIFSSNNDRIELKKDESQLDNSVNTCVMQCSHLDNTEYYLRKKTTNIHCQDTDSIKIDDVIKNNETSLEVCANDNMERVCNLPISTATITIPSSTQISPAMIVKMKDKMPNENQPNLETFKKKSIEFLTNTFFTFRSKSVSIADSTTSVPKKTKVSKDKSNVPKYNENSLQEKQELLESSTSSVIDSERESAIRIEDEITIKT